VTTRHEYRIRDEIWMRACCLRLATAQLLSVKPRIARVVRDGCFLQPPCKGRLYPKECPMIKSIDESTNLQSTWQSGFLRMLPEIRSWLKKSFRVLDRDSREEAVDEGVVHCLLAYMRLHQQGRPTAATPASLALYAARHVKRGRPAVGRMNSKDVLSRYAQIGNQIEIDRTQSEWIETLLLDQRASVPDVVATKLDVAAWWGTLTQRMRRIAHDLAIGWSTSEVALRHGLSASRISQLRRRLAESWAAFHHDPALASG
jgi:hypothetical protein